MFFIDFEAFQIAKGGDYIIKELAIVNSHNPLEPLYYLFEAPYPWHDLTEEQKRQCSYQSRNIHHLTWQDGIQRYCCNCVQYIILNELEFATSIPFYVMGNQKYKFLEKTFPYLKFIEYTATLESLPKLYPHIRCLSREHGDHCALKKAYRLYLHYVEDVE